LGSFEYHGHFVSNGASSRGIKLFEGAKGYPHSDGGFKLRSVTEGRLSFSKEPLKIDLRTLPCPLEKGDIGCYLLRVQVEQEVWDYMGKSAELKKGIADRLREHFIKLAGTASIHHVSQTENFKNVAEKLKIDLPLNPNSAEFFDKHVRLAFIKVSAEAKKNKEHVSKIEGMALAKYYDIQGYFPNLNSTDETKGLAGFEDLINSR
jgi:hypothetical protein